jgi:hypothetical protein
MVSLLCWRTALAETNEPSRKARLQLPSTENFLEIRLSIKTGEES